MTNYYETDEYRKRRAMAQESFGNVNEALLELRKEVGHFFAPDTDPEWLSKMPEKFSISGPEWDRLQAKIEMHVHLQGDFDALQVACCEYVSRAVTYFERWKEKILKEYSVPDAQ